MAKVWNRVFALIPQMIPWCWTLVRIARGLGKQGSETHDLKVTVFNFGSHRKRAFFLLALCFSPNLLKITETIVFVDFSGIKTVVDLCWSFFVVSEVSREAHALRHRVPCGEYTKWWGLRWKSLTTQRSFPLFRECNSEGEHSPGVFGNNATAPRNVNFSLSTMSSQLASNLKLFQNFQNC